MMKNCLILRTRAGLMTLGTVVVAHTPAAALDFTHKLSSTTSRMNFLGEILNPRESTVLLAVAAGLIVLGSALRRKLTSQNAREQSYKTAIEPPKEFPAKPLEPEATPRSAVAP
jgi:hypothetical protein